MKKVTLTVIAHDKDANVIAREMEKSYVAQLGVFTLACGDIQSLTKEDEEEFEDSK